MDKIKPKVSVIVPTFNSVKYIGKCVDSILSQDYGNIEIVIVDDGSVDNTEEFIKNEYRNSTSIKYIYKKNGGVSSARNVGINFCEGELIAFLDADDVYVESKISCQVRHFAENVECMMVYSDMFIFDERSLIHSSYHDKIGVNCPSGFIFNDLLLHHLVWTGTVMLKKSVLDDVGLFDESLKTAEDYDLWLRIAAKHRVDYIPKILSGYRRGHCSLTTDKNSKNKKYTKPDTVKVIENHIAHNKSLVNLTKKQINRRLFDVYFDFGLSSYKSGNYRNAKINFSEAMKLNKSDPKVVYYFIVSLLKG